MKRRSRKTEKRKMKIIRMFFEAALTPNPFNHFKIIMVEEGEEFTCYLVIILGSIILYICWIICQRKERRHTARTVQLAGCTYFNGETGEWVNLKRTDHESWEECLTGQNIPCTHKDTGDIHKHP